MTNVGFSIKNNMSVYAISWWKHANVEGNETRISTDKEYSISFSYFQKFFQQNNFKCVFSRNDSLTDSLFEYGHD